MRGVARSREDLQVEHAVADDADVLLRHRHERPPEPVEVVPVQPPGAPLEAARVDQVRRPDLAHVDEQARVLADEGAGRAGMVEMDVREQEVAELPDLEPVLGEPCPERVQAARRPAVDQRGLVAREQVGADHALAAEVLEVEELHPELLRP